MVEVSNAGAGFLGRLIEAYLEQVEIQVEHQAHMFDYKFQNTFVEIMLILL